MTIGDLNAFVALLLAIALAGERLVTALKNLFPEFSATEAKNEAKEIDLPKDRWRRLAVQALGFTFCWLAAAFMTKDGHFDLFGGVPLGSNANKALPAGLVGLLASSGSALWSGILGFTSATKDARRADAALGGLELASRARAAGALPPVDTGMAGREQRDPTVNQIAPEPGGRARPETPARAR